jgi:hypothetical protein
MGSPLILTEESILGYLIIIEYTFSNHKWFIGGIFDAIQNSSLLNPYSKSILMCNFLVYFRHFIHRKTQQTDNLKLGNAKILS